MSYDFASFRTPVASKDHRCEQCRRLIVRGERYSASAGKFDGDFWYICEHIECREVWLKIREFCDLYWDEEQPFLIHDGDLSEYRQWIEKDYPSVADRLWPKSEAA